MSNAHESHHFVCFLLANVFSTLQDNKQVELKNTILFSKKLYGGQTTVGNVNRSDSIWHFIGFIRTVKS